MTYFNFNTADDQVNSLIPDGTLAKVRMTIRKGGYNDIQKGWTDGWATLGRQGSIYLDCEFVVLHGKYAKRKIWSLIGLQGKDAESDTWYRIGRAFNKGIINSAHNLRAEDKSDLAEAKREIKSFGGLDGLEFVARIDVDYSKNLEYKDKNVIKTAILPDDPSYTAIKNGIAVSQPVASSSQSFGSPQASTVHAQVSAPYAPPNSSATPTSDGLDDEVPF